MGPVNRKEDPDLFCARQMQAVHDESQANNGEPWYAARTVAWMELANRLATAEMYAPFPYFGGKGRAAPLVWEALGDVGGYVEPFSGWWLYVSACGVGPVGQLQETHDG